MKNRTRQRRLRWERFDRADDDESVGPEWIARPAHDCCMTIRRLRQGSHRWHFVGWHPGTSRPVRLQGEVASSDPRVAQRAARDAWWGLAEHEGWPRRRAARLRNGHRREGPKRTAAAWAAFWEPVLDAAKLLSYL